MQRLRHNLHFKKVAAMYIVLLKACVPSNAHHHDVLEKHNASEVGPYLDEAVQLVPALDPDNPAILI
jgi:hypothetical protein